MNLIKIVQAVLLMAVLALAASCRTTRGGSDGGYPYPRNPDGNPYPEYPQYPDRPTYPRGEYPDYPPGDYPVNNDPNPGNLPPGQAKKIYGGKSARPYAPGQRKKQNNGYDRNYGGYKKYPDNVYKTRSYPLIIQRTRDMIIERERNGRLFYRHPDGLIYWKGYDDRYYLDEKYLSYARYTQKEYDDWRYKGDNLSKIRDRVGIKRK